MVYIVKHSLTYNELHAFVEGYGAYSRIIVWQLESINKIRDEVRNFRVVISSNPLCAVYNQYDVYSASTHVLRGDCEHIQRCLTHNSDRRVYAIVNAA